MSKERLVELLKNIDFEYCEECEVAAENGCKSYPQMSEYFADHILADGWIRLPCKVGQTLYFLYDRTFANRPDFTPRIYETNDWYFDIDEKGISILTRSIHSYKGKHHYYLGETVFTSREEVKQALEGKTNGQ